jgi:hypothetical protein
LTALITTPDVDDRTLPAQAALYLRLLPHGDHHILWVSQTLADLLDVAGVWCLRTTEALSYQCRAPSH